MNKGYFDDAKQEYVIQDMFPRRRLINYLWNEETVCQLDHFGCGFTWTKIGYDRKYIESGDRLIFIKDLDNNFFILQIAILLNYHLMYMKLMLV